MSVGNKCPGLRICSLDAFLEPRSVEPRGCKAAYDDNCDTEDSESTSAPRACRQPGERLLREPAKRGNCAQAKALRGLFDVAFFNRFFFLFVGARRQIQGLHFF